MVYSMQTVVRFSQTNCFLQDVRKMCADEMEQITREINKMEKAGHKRKAVNQVRAQLVFLRDQLTRLEAKLDTAKRMLYFPAAKGYRFDINFCIGI